MTTTSRGGRESVRIMLALTIMSIVTLLAACPNARAATTAPNYTISQVTYATGTPVSTCRGWGGASDAAGHLYLACPVKRDLDANGTGDVSVPALYELDEAGRVVQIGYLPTEYHFNDAYPIRDVGVSPDGRSAYVSVGPNTDNLGQHPENNPTTGQPMAGGATTGSVLRLTRQANGTWEHDPSFKAGPFLFGDSWWAARYVDVDASGHVYVSVNAYVYELDPKTGARISAFGGATTNGPGGSWVEGFDNAAGISVAPDGRSIYVVDQQFHLVQRWLRVGATDWTRDRGFLLGSDEEGEGLCATNDHFQSPYDVGVDGAGDVYILDTSCQRIQRFTRTGAFVQTVWSNAGGDDFNHGFGVNWQGNIVLPIEERVLVRSDPPARPAPDDADRPALRARSVVRIAGSGCSTIPPTRRLPASLRLHVADRCARITGRVTSIARTARGWSIRIEVPARVARLLFTNATGAAPVTILTDRHTRIRRSVRPGRPVTVTGTVAARRGADVIYVLPADMLASG